MTFGTPQDRSRAIAPAGNLMQTPDYLEALVHKDIKPFNWRGDLRRIEAEAVIAEREEQFRLHQAQRRAARLAKIEAIRKRNTETPSITYLNNPLRTDRLIKLFADVVQFGYSDIVSNGSGSRRKEPVYYRQILMWILNKLGTLNKVAIGRRIGNRDHTTVIHAVNKINGNPAMFDETQTIMKALLWREHSIYGTGEQK